MSKLTMSHGLHVSFNLPQIIIKQLADALTEIHSRGVFHRDIKLDNIVIETGPDGPRVRIIDFGSGTSLSEGMYTTEQGRLSFLLSSSLSQSSIFAVFVLYLRPSPLNFVSVWLCAF